jgi:chorismate dehydratase
VLEQISLSQDIPSVVAEKLISGRADIGLLPSIVITQIPGARVISDYCIGSNGAVSSVCIYAQCPLEEVECIFLDYQSRTSVELARILVNDFWKLSPEFLPAKVGYENKINGKTAGLIIGDRALQLKPGFKYCYDLGEAWKDFTGLPFVFACWVTTQQLSEPFLQAFNAALEAGVEQVHEVAKQNQFFYPGIDVASYLTEKISFTLDEEKKKALQHFLALSSNHVPVIG